jgi:AcrR family transcriptional regulator
MPTQVVTERRQQILEQSAKLFTSKGYQATSMRELALHVGLEPASLYSHFKSKEDLLWQLASSCAEDFHLSVGPIANGDLQPSERLAEMIATHVEVVVRNQHSAAIFISEWQQLSEPRRTEYANSRNAYEQYFRNIIALGVDQGVFRAIEPKFGALTVLSALNFTYQWYRPKGSLTPRQTGQKLAEVLINGMKA